MRILFDQNVPRPLGRHLALHEVTRSVEKGWEQLKNGDLLTTAEEHGFDLLLTCDRKLEYQRELHGRRIAIIALSTNNWPLIREHIHEIAAAVDGATSGTYLSVECGIFHKRTHPSERTD